MSGYDSGRIHEISHVLSVLRHQDPVFDGPDHSRVAFLLSGFQPPPIHGKRFFETIHLSQVVSLVEESFRLLCGSVGAAGYTRERKDQIYR